MPPGSNTIRLNHHRAQTPLGKRHRAQTPSGSPRGKINSWLRYGDNYGIRMASLDDDVDLNGGDINGILHKPSKKLKLSCVGETNKKVKLPKKFLLDCHRVDDVYVPRRLRTGITKRLKENVSPSSQSPTNWIHKNEMPLEKSSNKKTNVYVDKQRHSTMLKLFAEQITEDEKEAIVGLLALARINSKNNNTNKINLNKEIAEAEDSKCKDLVIKHVQIHDLIDSNTIDVKKDSKDITYGNKSRKRCCSRMYICRMIKNLQIIEGRKVNSQIEPRTDTTPVSNTDCSVGIISNEARRTTLQPYFGNPFCDPSQWSRPMFPNQEMWMNPFIHGARNQNWQNDGHELMASHSGSYVQGSTHHLRYKMQFCQRTSGYGKNGGLLQVDSPLALKLTLQ
ncbi:mastermind-like protein 2 isoform X1 [Tanacetum coccineum]|uniref:Mastermind-like protein 2 isoform X1 n=1 Tax=Tanacetum coccineum TaxID=301880 RepID=A0ABQ5F5A2_9ASTR